MEIEERKPHEGAQGGLHMPWWEVKICTLEGQFWQQHGKGSKASKPKGRKVSRILLQLLSVG